MIAAVLAFIRALLPSTATLALWGGLGLIAAGAVTWWSVHQYNKGWYAHAAAQAAQDKEAIDAVASALADIEHCRASGGVWRTSTGHCERR